MGIKGFTAWLKSRYPSAFTPYYNRKALDEVYVDVNSLLHLLSRTSTNENQILRGVRRHISSLFRDVSPQAKLYLAMDGPAALGKVPLQRARRVEAAEESLRKGIFDSRQFTPGCLLMTRVEGELHSAIDKRIIETKTFNTNCLYIIDGSTNAGEGETKVFYELQKDIKSNKNLTKVLLAQDSDSLLHALATMDAKLSVLPPIWASRGMESRLSFSVGRMMDALQREVKAKRPLEQLVADFVTLGALSGNDYIPATRFGSLKGLWNYYLSFDNAKPFLKDSTLTVDPFAMRDNSAHLIKHCMPAYALGLLGSVEGDSFAKTPEEKHQAIVHYLHTVNWVIGNLFGAIKPGVDCSILYPYRAGPSLEDFAKMDAARVAEDVAKLDAGDMSQSISPAVAPLLLLSPDKHSIQYISKALVATFEEFGKMSFSSDKDAVTWLKEQISKIPHTAYTELELKTLTQRPPLMTSHRRHKWLPYRREALEPAPMPTIH